MADIELVIKIDENTYHRIINGFANEDDAVLFEDLFKNGVILPKGHGRLMILSEDAVKREQCIVSFSRQNWISEVGLSNATVAIIEADKAESEEISDTNLKMWQEIFKAESEGNNDN